MTVVFLRTLIVFISIIISMRVMGKRQLGELELSEFVVAVMISDLASNPLQDIGIPLLNGLIPILVLLCFEIIISGVVLHNMKWRVLLCGRPSMLIEKGKINQIEMRKNRFTLDELTEELRSQSVTDLSTVEYAVLETNGKLSVTLIPSERPVTAGQLSIPTEDLGYDTIIINDGNLIPANLKRIGRDENWLRKELSSRKAHDIKDVYIMIANNAGSIYFARNEDIKR